MKKIIKIISTFIALIIVNYNICFADMIAGPRIFGHGKLSEIIALLLPLTFFLGLILIIVEIVTYICKKKKLEDTNKIESIINKTNIFLAILASICIFLILLFYETSLWGITLIVGSIIAIIARKKKQIKISNIICGLIVIFSIPSLIEVLFS